MNDSAMLVEGFSHYNEMCSTCHGGPGVSPDELAKGLYPRPPKFYKSDDMPDTAEAFWIIKNGIKFTSMPAFGPTHSDQKIWAITDFLLNKMNKMSPEEYQEWKKEYSGKETD
jgi:mono/diheme cytochrome c family protein